MEDLPQVLVFRRISLDGEERQWFLECALEFGSSQSGFADDVVSSHFPMMTECFDSQ